MFRISATLLDGFRLYREADFIETGEIEARIRGDASEPTEDMRLGTAFHAIAEGIAEPCGDHGDRPAYCFGGFVFDAESADAALSAYCGGVAEVKATLPIATPHGPALLVCKADYLRGNGIRELKTRRKPFDVETYADSLQWRSYLLAFDAARIVYDLVRLDEADGVFFAAEHDALPLYPYPGMRDDVEREARALVAFAHERGLLPYLTAAQERAEQRAA